MRPSTACVSCRTRRRKCERGPIPQAGCRYCHSHGLKCSVATYPNLNGASSESLPQGEPYAPPAGSPLILSPALHQELVLLYFQFINDKFHSLFHQPSVVEKVHDGTIPNIILYAMISLSARFSDHPHFAETDPRDRGKPFAQEAARLLDIGDLSVKTIQACVLLGATRLADGSPEAEGVYYSVACRMAMIMKLPSMPVASRLEREVNIRVWWSLSMIDVWSSSGLKLPRSLSPEIDVPLPIEESAFLQLTNAHPNTSELIERVPSFNSSPSLLGEMIKLNSILAEVNIFNELVAGNHAFETRNYDFFETVSQRLEEWYQSLPEYMKDTIANLERYADQGLGALFVTVYLGYYNYGQMLYYQFLHLNCHDKTPQIQTYADRCKFHATNLCNILYRAYSTPGCDVLYTMVGHILVIASTIQLHILLFDTDEIQIRYARLRLEKNFEILTRLQRFWPSLDLSFARLREFHKACQQSTEESFRMDQWMLRFLLEFAKPVGERDREEIGDDESWTMGNLGFSPLQSGSDLSNFSPF